VKRFLAIVSFWVASLCCATTAAYTGPAGDRPLLSVTYQRHLVTDDPRFPPQMKTLATANVVNPSDHPMALTLECTETRTTIYVAPRTTQHVLLDPEDAGCILSR
jgi:hypothetical protein